ncbi:hypothetical protein MCHUDSM44219_01987 [Mycolicibacterium chubuense]|uniref:Uncharacterized protein n=1 Tax=Mycolicibacterium chubuense TaxID=1800 RepID=A0A0J6WGS7_MYCCU|nr:hypothetical protein MCHUDSM44219_01987 [Mycolicibacterium chubuense]SPY00838.1 type III restriction enzyme, res subunit [Mycolicibacterium chubuense]
MPPRRTSDVLADLGVHPSPALGRYFKSASSADTTFSTLVVSPVATSEDLSTQLVNNPDLFQRLLAELVPIIYRSLKQTA